MCFILGRYRLAENFEIIRLRCFCFVVTVSTSALLYFTNATLQVFQGDFQSHLNSVSSDQSKLPSVELVNQSKLPKVIKIAKLHISSVQRGSANVD